LVDNLGLFKPVTVMTLSSPTTSLASPVESSSQSAAKLQQPMPAVQPTLEKLFELYPALFGAEFLPLKLGVFQELLAAHPDVFTRDTLKAALGVHTRSARYLQSVAAGKKRHDLLGQPGDDVAPEHIYMAILELYRRRQGRTRADLGPQLRAQLLAAYEASGLPRADYLTQVQPRGGEIHPALTDALAELDQKLAKQEALRRAFAASGKTVAEFADMYGLPVAEVAPFLQAAPPQPVSA
jgi:ProP effector